MLKKILIGLAVIVVVFLIVVATRPDAYRVERSLTIAAPAEVAFAEVNDFHKWQPWSPWAKLDPNQKNTYSGEPAGAGAVNHWSGNDQVGEGEMKILESQAPSKIIIDLKFIRPFESQSLVDFTFAPENDGVKVTWGMNGKHNFISKAMCLFMDMDKMLGGDFERGLAGLKTIAETEAARLKAEAEKAAAEKAAADAAAAEGAVPAPVAEVK
jgi:uncharacterized protein YndB with AHSA1/START domain